MLEKKILQLTVSKEWFDLICQNKKDEEYREIKPYWANRLVKKSDKNYVGFDEFGGYTTVFGKLEYIPFTHVLFCHGYATDRPTIEKEIVGITIGKPKKGLCPDMWLDKEFFIIKFK